jgi:hypothetical protein
MLDEIDNYLALTDRHKLVFSLKARLRSFIGQYGGITPDIAAAMIPFMKEERLTVEDASDDQIIDVTRMIRSKLMP